MLHAPFVSNLAHSIWIDLSEKMFTEASCMISDQYPGASDVSGEVKFDLHVGIDDQ